MRLAPLMLLALSTAALAQTGPSAPAAKPVVDGDKVICKRFAEVGSLIASKKECKTKREWSAESDAAQHRLSDCVNQGASTGAHC